MKKFVLSLLLGSVLITNSPAMEVTTLVISKVLSEPGLQSKAMILKQKDSSETLQVDMVPVLVDHDVASASIAGTPGQGTGILITLTAEGKKKLAEATKNSIGQRMAIQLEGELVAAPMIREQLTGGSVIISGNFSTEFAKRVVDTINKNKH